MRTCRPTAGGAPSRLDASPRSHRSWSLTNNHHNCYPQGTKAVSHLLCVHQHRTTVCSFTHFRLPRKKETRLLCLPDMPSSVKKKTRANWTLPFTPLPHTCLCCLPVPKPDSRLSRRARSARGWSFALGPGSRGTGQLGIVCHQAGRTNRTHRPDLDS